MIYLQVCLKDTGTLDVSDVATGTIESLEFSEPVEAFALGHGRLLVATGSQVSSSPDTRTLHQHHVIISCIIFHTRLSCLGKLHCTET